MLAHKRVDMCVVHIQIYTYLETNMARKMFNITRYLSILKYTPILLPKCPSISFIEPYQKSKFLKACRYHVRDLFRKKFGKNLKFLKPEFVDKLCERLLMLRIIRERIILLAASDCGICLIVSIRNMCDL